MSTNFEDLFDYNENDLFGNHQVTSSPTTSPARMDATNTTTTTSNVETFVPYSTVSTLSDGQEMTLVLLQLFSCCLSLIGSCLIVFKVVRNRTKTTPYDRIMLGLSTSDIVATISYALGPFLLPQDTSQRVWAFGTDGTCTMIGFLTQLAFWAVWYNGMLSFYYLLTVRFKVKRHDFAMKYEKWIHISGLLFFPATAITGIVGDFYSEMQLTQSCWVGEVPKGCTAAGTCTGLGQIIAYVFGGLPIAFTLIALIVNNIVIYCFVRRSFRAVDAAAAAAAAAASKDGATSSTRTATDVDSTSTGFPTLQRQSSSASLSSSSHSRRKTITTTHEVDGETMTEQQFQRKLRQQRQTKEVATQGFLYVATFLLTFTPAFILQVIDGLGFGEEDQDNLYWVLILNSILLPLQGFFNVFIYVKPNYSRFKAANPDENSFWALKCALSDPDIPKLTTIAATQSRIHYGMTTGGSFHGGSGRSRGNSRRSGNEGSSTQGGNNKQRTAMKSKSYGSNFSSTLDKIEEGIDEDLDISDRLYVGTGDNRKYQKGSSDDDDEDDDDGGESHDDYILKDMLAKLKQQQAEKLKPVKTTSTAEEEGDDSSPDNSDKAAGDPDEETGQASGRVISGNVNDYHDSYDTFDDSLDMEAEYQQAFDDDQQQQQPLFHKSAASLMFELHSQKSETYQHHGPGYAGRPSAAAGAGSTGGVGLSIGMDGSIMERISDTSLNDDDDDDDNSNDDMESKFNDSLSESQEFKKRLFISNKIRF